LAWRRWQEQRVLKHATLAVCNSSYTANVIRHEYGLPEGKTTVIYKAVDTTGFEPPASLPPNPLPGTVKGRRLLFVGTDWHTKGLDVLLRAVAQLKSFMPDLCVAVVGPAKEDVQLNSIIKNLGLRSHVKLVGRLPSYEVARYLWHSDVLVLPSRREALGVAVLEAMAAGVPVVATNVGGIPELVCTPEQGALVAPEDPVSLARAVKNILDSPGRQAAARVAGPQRADQFAVDSMVQKIRLLYRSLAGARGPVPDPSRPRASPFQRNA
jgi:glycosyltransferase involved in cell wall biosynthesis